MQKLSPGKIVLARILHRARRALGEHQTHHFLRLSLYRRHPREHLSLIISYPPLQALLSSSVLDRQFNRLGQFNGISHRCIYTFSYKRCYQMRRIPK